MNWKTHIEAVNMWRLFSPSEGQMTSSQDVWRKALRSWMETRGGSTESLHSMWSSTHWTQGSLNNKNTFRVWDRVDICTCPIKLKLSIWTLGVLHLLISNFLILFFLRVFPGGPVGRIPPFLGPQVWSLVGELWSHKSCGMATHVNTKLLLYDLCKQTRFMSSFSPYEIIF